MNFRAIEAMRKEKGRLRNLSEEEYKQVYGKADSLLGEVAQVPGREREGIPDYMALDRAIECLTEAFGSKKTEKGIRSFLEKEYGLYGDTGYGHEAGYGVCGNTCLRSL